MRSIQLLLAVFFAYTGAAVIPQDPLREANKSVAPFALTAGIGAEFESSTFKLFHKGCEAGDSIPIKGHSIVGRERQNFKLTVDIDPNPEILHLEYYLDGKAIKVGSGDAAKVGAAVAKDISDWRPWDLKPMPLLTVDKSRCNPWEIVAPPPGTDPMEMRWEPQITAAMPLEAIYHLMLEQKADPKKQRPRNVLNGGDYLQPLVVITKEYFKSSGVDTPKLTDDVLAFCSLVMTYAKNVMDNNNGKVIDSVKDATSLMPRTEFNTLYSQVKPKFPASVNLPRLFNSLACYTTSKDGKVVLDQLYCTGQEDNPKSTGLFSKLRYINKLNKNAQMSVIDWITQLGEGGAFPDLLTRFDQSFDSAIGGYGAILEKMYQSEREVPLFEFRNLPFIPMKEFEGFMGRADKGVQELHLKFAHAPQVVEYQDDEQEL